MKVFVVTFDNYGDQGVDYVGVFSTEKLAKDFIIKTEPVINERQYYDIFCSEVDNPQNITCVNDYTDN